MLKKVIFFFVMGIFLVSCATVPTTPSPAKTPQEIVVKVEAAEPTKVTVEEGQKERVNKSMEVANPEGRLSQLSFIANDKAGCDCTWKANGQKPTGSSFWQWAPSSGTGCTASSSSPCSAWRPAIGTCGSFRRP